MEGPKLSLEARDLAEESNRLLDGHFEDIRDRLSFIKNVEGLPVISFSLTNLAQHVHVREEVHLNFTDPVPFALIASSPLDIKAEPADFVPPHLRFRQLRIEVPDEREEPRVRRGVRARRAP